MKPTDLITLGDAINKIGHMRHGSKWAKAMAEERQATEGAKTGSNTLKNARDMQKRMKTLRRPIELEILDEFGNKKLVARDRNGALLPIASNTSWDIRYWPNLKINGKSETIYLHWSALTEVFTHSKKRRRGASMKSDWPDEKEKTSTEIGQQKPVSPRLNSALISLAKLANVPAEKSQLLKNYVAEAVNEAPESEINTKVSMGEAVKVLKKVANKAKALSLQIRHLRRRSIKSDWNKNDVARMFLAGSLNDCGLSPNQTMKILLDFFAPASDAVSEAQKFVKEGRSIKTPAFDTFAERLLWATMIAGGELSILRTKDGERHGTFLKAIELLRPSLPTQFVPTIGLGRKLEVILDRWNRRKAALPMKK
jgi:hypothetical protein